MVSRALDIALLRAYFLTLTAKKMITKRYKRIPGKQFLFCEQVTILEGNPMKHEKEKVNESLSAVEFMRKHEYYHSLNVTTSEVMYAMYLSRSNSVIGIEEMGKGSESGILADMKKMYAGAINVKATGVILFHNHPSGRLAPSQQDLTVTKAIKAALKYCNITLIDHIIITKDDYYSLADKGEM